MILSRRTLLLQGTALAISTPLETIMASGSDGDRSSEVGFGYVGDKSVQITVVDTLFDTSEVVSVEATDRVDWSPNPFDMFGSVGRLNGEEGVFSGDRSTSQPQLFQAWPKIAQGSRKDGFRQSKVEHKGRSLADKPQNWRVTINGKPVDIVSLYRKSTPIRTLAIGVRRWANTKRHLVTFELNREIPEGAIVGVIGPSVPFVEHRKMQNTFSEALHVCQAGYPLSGPKKAYVGSWWGHDKDGGIGSTDTLLSEKKRWSVISEQDGTVIRTGNLSLVKPASESHMNEKNFNGCDVYEADFSDLDLEGDFRLHVEGLGVSYPFGVSVSPYTEALRLAARWYFHQRSGCEISDPFGEGITRPRNGHPDDGLTVRQTNVKLGDTAEGLGQVGASILLSQNTEEMDSVEISQDSTSIVNNPDAWGGWHDAGDWDRRIQHMNVVYHMADIVETFESTRSLNLNLPESGKPFSHSSVNARKNDLDLGDGETVLPDLVHEALWGISLWRRTQGDSGAIIGGVEYSKSSIWGSVSWNPVQNTYAYAPEGWAGYQFAIGAAKLGHVIKEVCGDATLGDTIVGEAVKAWRWAEQQFSSNGEFFGYPNSKSDKAVARLARTRIAASAVVFRASGDEHARQIFDDHNSFVPLSSDPIKGIKKEVFSYSNLEYVRASREGRATNPEIVKAIEEWIKNFARKGGRMGRDFGLHNTETYPWGRGWLRFGPGSNWRANHFALYYASNGEISPKMMDAAIEGMWFGLGCNPSNVSFVQGLGHRSFSDPLTTDRVNNYSTPGQISFGVAGGEMHDWELRKTSGSIFPSNQDDWPIYAQIFESSSIAISAEHGIKSNALEWLIACALTTSL